MKLCINCRHYQPSNEFPAGSQGSVAYSRCTAILQTMQPADLSFIDGREPEKKWTFCTTARAYYGDCGPDAKMFAAKLEVVTP